MTIKTGRPSLSATLAIDGGTPLRGTPFPSWPYYADDEVAATGQVLRSGRANYWAGEQGRLFEREFAAYCGTDYGIALSNGTVALELALRVLGIGPGDEVLVPPRSFVASASVVALRGATPVFVDIDPDTQCMDPGQVTASVSARTRAIIVVHLGGWPVDMDAICALADQHGLVVIEDCAQAHGAAVRGRKVGSFGHMAAFSFCQDKIMSTGGEGGMLLTNDEGLWRAAWEFKDHGKNHDALRACEQDPLAVFCWVHDSFGTNWRLTEMQSAIGRAQLRKLDDWLVLRRRNAAVLEDRLGANPVLRIAQVPPDLEHARYKFHVFVRDAALASGWSRDRIMRAINAEGIPCFYGGCSEIYREKAFVEAGFVPEAPLPVAQQFSRSSMMFNVHPTLSVEDMHQMADGIEKVLAVAMRS